MKKCKDFKSLNEALEYAKKKEAKWKHLIAPDPLLEKCGEPWDDWNTKIVPARLMERKIKEALENMIQTVMAI